MSELAVRLGSPVTFDRSGNVLFQECFEGGLANWEHNSYPSGANAVPTARFHSIKPYAIKLHTTTDDNSYSGIKRGLPFPYLSRMGFEFHYKQIAAINNLFIRLYFYTGTKVYTVTLELKQNDDEIVLTGHPNIPNVICNYKLSQVNYAPFHVFKIVFDLSTGYHYRMVIDDLDYNISSITIPYGATSIKAHMYILFYLYSFEESAKTCYIDNLVLTIDEPM